MIYLFHPQKLALYFICYEVESLYQLQNVVERKGKVEYLMGDGGSLLPCSLSKSNILSSKLDWISQSFIFTKDLRAPALYFLFFFWSCSLAPSTSSRPAPLLPKPTRAGKIHSRFMPLKTRNCLW